MLKNQPNVYYYYINFLTKFQYSFLKKIIIMYLKINFKENIANWSNLFLKFERFEVKYLSNNGGYF